MAENPLTNYLADPGGDRSLLVTALGGLGLLRSDSSQDFSDEEKSVIRSNIGAASLEQGNLAGTALQPGDVGTTAGTVAAGNDSRITGAVQKSANLSDLADVVIARTNLELGTAATQPSTAFATAAQGATADSALQPFSGIGDGATDNRSAILASGRDFYAPPGDYYFTGFDALTAFLRASVSGAGRFLYDNGSFTEEVGKSLWVGASDADNNLGAHSAGGIVLANQSQYGSNGSRVYSTGPSWTTVEAYRIGNPAILQVYAMSYMGFVSVTNGSNICTVTYGFVLAADFRVNDIVGVNGARYKVATVNVDGSGVVTSWTTKNVNGSAMTFGLTGAVDFYHAYEICEGRCDVNGTAVTWRDGGDYFNTSYSPTGSYTIDVNGVQYLQNGQATSQKSLALTTSAGTQTNVPFKQRIGANYITMFKWQGIKGGNETGVSAYIDDIGEFQMRSLYAGIGAYKRMKFGTGQTTGGALRDQVVIETNGDVSIGGLYGFETIRVFGNDGGATKVVEHRPGFSTFAPQERMLNYADPNDAVGKSWVAQKLGRYEWYANTFADFLMSVEKGNIALRQQVTVPGIVVAANDGAAASAGVPIKGLYENSTTHAIQVRAV